MLFRSYTDGKFLANTTGTFNGNLTISGNTNPSSYVTIANSTFNTSNAALVKIIGSTGGAYITPAASGYMLDVVGVDGSPSRIVNTAFGANTYGAFIARHANGTAASPTATANNDVIARFSGNGYNGSQFNATGQGRIDVVAAENFTTSNTGSRIEMWNSVVGSNTLIKIATFNSSDVVFSGDVIPQKGIVYTPNTISGNVTSFTLDMANNATYKLSCNSALTITPSGFKPGKICEVWLTHYGNNNDAINTGLAALNSTKGTSFNVNVPALIHLRYYSINGDLANTYVSVTYG